MALLFRTSSDRTEWWLEEFKARIPELEIRVWPDLGNTDDIEFALVWDLPHGQLRRLHNLRLIISLGAGVDHLFADPNLPRNMPIARVGDWNLTQRMTEYVLLHVLRYHRQLPTYESQQREARWTELLQPAAADRRVGIMGFGVLGGDVGQKLLSLGFDVAAWSRRPKSIDNVESFHGPDGLSPFLDATEILVCLLPITPQTAGIIDARTLAALPQGACIINVARGEHVVEEDLLAALDSGHIAGATLDVFHEEPLPPEHPFWHHPRVTVTPHAASFSDPRSVLTQVIENLRRVWAGEPPLYRVDIDQGY